MTRFGVVMFATDYAIQPVELAQAVEERGLDSLFFPEHTHIPTSRRTPFPAGGELPREYKHTHDPFVALAAAAAVTRRIRLGTGICLIPQHDPIVLAKTVASLDVVSKGRFVLGIGAGWNAEEMLDHGTQFETRWKVLRERVLAMKKIWSDEAAEFHGEFVNFDPLWSWPKPVQPGGPPILLGAASRWGFARVAEFCDGWMPIAGTRDMKKGLAQLRSAVEAAGRDFDRIEKVLFGGPPNVEGASEAVAMGFGELIFWLPPAGRDEVLPRLDRYAELVRKLR
jgi:probable F420-dependent oxidoreductase